MTAKAWKNVLSLLFVALILIPAACSTSNDSTPGTTEPDCLVDDECPIGEECFDGVCRPAGYIPCTVDEECPVGMFCVDGMCQGNVTPDGDKDDTLPPDGDDQDDPDPVITDGDDDTDDAVTEQDTINMDFLCQPCASDPECPGDQNFCIEDNTGSTFCGATCRNTADCPDGYLCKNFPYGNQCTPLDGFCEQSCIDTGCPDGQACDPETGTCKPVGTGTQEFCEPCSNNSECMEDGVCIPDATGNTFCGVDCLDAPCEIPNTYCRRIDEQTRQCWPMNNACASGCNCETINCANHFECNAMDCQCYPDSTHCSTAGCTAGLNCDPGTGDCVEGPVDNCCVNPSICAAGTTCNQSTCQCEAPSGSCNSDAECAPGQVCETMLLHMCLDEYCNACESTFDCSSFFSSCINGGCANQCTSDAQCPAGAHCQIDFFSGYCVPDSGFCSGEDPCQGVTYEGECRGNDLYWCENNQLNVQHCDDVPAICDITGDNYFCLGTNGAPCDGSNPPCAIGYDCVDDVCTGGTVDGDTDTVDSDPDPVDSDPDPVDTVEDECGGVPATGECRGNVLYWCDNGETKIENCALLTASACAQHSDNAYYCIGNEGASCDARHPCTTGLSCVDGTCQAQSGGNLGDPCPNSYEADCNASTTDDCLSNEDNSVTFCSVSCTSDSDCTAIQSDYCCRAISGGSQFCLPPEFCTGGDGTCNAPYVIPGLPVSDTDTLSGTSNWLGGCDGSSGWGPEMVYSVELTAGQRVQITATSSDVDIQIYLANGCKDNDYTMCEETDRVVSGEETLEVTIYSTGTYYVIIDAFGTYSTGSYTMTMSSI